MNDIPKPIFNNKISKISWQKIYEREYGVQYSEMAITCLTSKAKHHFPKTSVNQIVIPSKNNTVFYIDSVAWLELVEELNKSYTSNFKNLEKYEQQFIFDGKAYLETSKGLSKTQLSELTNAQLKELYSEYQKRLFAYSLFAWSAYILNEYVANRATTIIDRYIQRSNKEALKQDIYDSLFNPTKRAAILQLQYEVEKNKDKLTEKVLKELHERFKWLSCLDIHNPPWTPQEFKKHIEPFTKSVAKKVLPFSRITQELKIKTSDLDFLLMAKRFVFIKDARDDYRRQGVFYAQTFFKELARRIGIDSKDISYLQEKEVIDFLDGKTTISRNLIAERKKGFVLYLDKNRKLICLQGQQVNTALKSFNLIADDKSSTEISGMVASKGTASGKVVIVRGVKDLVKVMEGDILVAVTTHPDYVPAMRRAIAIVTDEGGVTSHAAIVAREFGLPCIVGTKKATHILKDRDLVEVNAEEGWVKKL